jgi:hypothetical protein
VDKKVQAVFTGSERQEPSENLRNIWKGRRRPVAIFRIFRLLFPK